jgi:hypothetical protein
LGIHFATGDWDLGVVRQEGDSAGIPLPGGVDEPFSESSFYFLYRMTFAIFPYLTITVWIHRQNRHATGMNRSAPLHALGIHSPWSRLGCSATKESRPLLCPYAVAIPARRCLSDEHDLPPLSSACCAHPHRDHATFLDRGPLASGISRDFVLRVDELEHDVS